MKIAYFSPLNPQPSGISDYSEELLPYVAAAGADISLFVDGFKPTNVDLLAQFACHDYRRDPSVLELLKDFDAVVYHMGNDHRYHAGIFDVMRRHPGVVVLHDFALHDFFLGRARQLGNMDFYLDEVAACHGEIERLRSEEHLRRGSVPPQVATPLSFPLNCRVVREAEGIIVHSEWGRAQLARPSISVPVAHLAMPIAGTYAEAGETVPEKDRQQAKVQIGSFGLINPDKGIELTIRTLALLRNQYDFHYTLVGPENPFFDVRSIVDANNMRDRMTITGQVSLVEFERRMAETDIAINFRERTVGETSASLCRIMSAGVASVVANVGWYSELPDDCVVKVPLDGHSEAMLLAFLKRLIEDGSLRSRIGQNARRYILAHHAIERTANDYLAFIARVIDQRARRKLVAGVSRELSLLGFNQSDEHLLRSVAMDIGSLSPPSRDQVSGPAARRSVDDNGHSSTSPAQATFLRNTPTSSPPLERATPGRLPKIEGMDYKRAAVEYLGKLSEERQHHLRTKPFYNLANKLPRYKNEGLDEDSHRHLCDFANMAVALALPPGSRVLDVGCGSGWLSEYFARLGYEVTGIDISPDLIEMSRERVARVPYGVDHETPLRCAFEVHDIEQSSLPDKFDAIICYDSLHHFEDEHSVIRHLALMLDVGGQLFILEGERPAGGSESEDELRAVMNEFRTLESPFDPNYLRTLLDENGLAVIGDYVSVNGLFERQTLEGNRLLLTNLDRNYHYLVCKKVAERGPASDVPDSRLPAKLSADLNLLTAFPASVGPGARIEARLSVTNTGDTIWLTGQSVRAGMVMPGLRIFDNSGSAILERHGPLLAAAVGPGETVNVKIECRAPLFRGHYHMKVDLVDQHVCWFEERGSRPLMFEFHVE